MKRAISPLVALLILAGPALLFAQEDKRTPTMTVVFHARVIPPVVSPEGFVEGSDKILVDSVADIIKAMNGRVYWPLKGYAGSVTRYQFTPKPDEADIVLTVAARGESAEQFGSRTKLSYYRNTVLADTVPTVGITRWVSMVIEVSTYKKELSAWSANRSQYSMGAWTAVAQRLTLDAAAWVMANEAQIKARQVARGFVEPLPPQPKRTCAKRDGTVVPCESLGLSSY